MPAQAVPFIALIVAAFVFFILVVGGFSIWCESRPMPEDHL